MTYREGDLARKGRAFDKPLYTTILCRPICPCYAMEKIDSAVKNFFLLLFFSCKTLGNIVY